MKLDAYRRAVTIGALDEFFRQPEPVKPPVVERREPPPEPKRRGRPPKVKQ